MLAMLMSNRQTRKVSRTHFSQEKKLEKKAATNHSKQQGQSAKQQVTFNEHDIFKQQGQSR
jgi:hypothetical protein